MTASEILNKCANRKCKHIYRREDTVYIPTKDYGESKGIFQGVCPKCGGKTFYEIKK